MPDYAAQIKAADRWAIAAYIRALQLSEHATLADVPAAERAERSMPLMRAGRADGRRRDPRAAPALQRRLLLAGAVGAAALARRRCSSTRRSSSSRT